MTEFKKFSIGDVVVNKAALERCKAEWRLIPVVEKSLPEATRKLLGKGTTLMPKLPATAIVQEVVEQHCHGGTQTFYLLNTDEGLQLKVPGLCLVPLSEAEKEAISIIESAASRRDSSPE